jgi:hypothetical protein
MSRAPKIEIKIGDTFARWTGTSARAALEVNECNRDFSTTVQLFEKYNAWMHRRLRLDSLYASILLIVGLCPLSLTQSVRYETSVAPLSDEDIASSCHYELTIPSQVKKAMAVWVIFDRGRDVHELYSDEAVLQFAGRFRIALLLHGHCPGKRPEDHNDMDMDPSKGLGLSVVCCT